MWLEGGERSLEFTKSDWKQDLISKIMADFLANFSSLDEAWLLAEKKISAPGVDLRCWEGGNYEKFGSNLTHITVWMSGYLSSRTVGDHCTNVIVI